MAATQAKTHIFKVGMTCEGCSGAVDRVLGKLKGKGVDEIIIDLKAQTVQVKTTLPTTAIIELIKKTGKEVELLKTL